MANSSMEALGAMASTFNPPPGGFDDQGNYHATGGYDPSGSYDATAGGSMSFDARTLNTLGAVQGAVAMGGGVLPPGVARSAAILPAALKIGELKKMQGVAAKYYEKYIKDFNRKYGFSEDQTKELIEEFNDVTAQITRLIPDEDMKNMYKKYIESYPTMYLSMIPAEALQTKLAVKCVTENRNLREKIEQMSSCVSTLVRNLTDLQISAGIPPIVNLMFESMPDPLTAMTDPMYHKYNNAIVTYHKLLQDDGTNDKFPRIDGAGSSAGTIHNNAEHLRLEPVHFLKKLEERVASSGGAHGVMTSVTKDADGAITNATELKDDKGNNVILSQEEIKELRIVMENMQTQSGCQPFGEEWNHTGPTPPMNPAMCLADGDNFQTGNPRHEIGRTNMYQAKRDRNGNAHWVQSGQVPALSGGGPQMVQHTSQHPSQHMSQHPSQHMSQHPSQHMSQNPSQHMSQHPSQAQFAQPYMSGVGAVGATGGSSGGKLKRSSKSRTSSRSSGTTTRGSSRKKKTSSGKSK